MKNRGLERLWLQFLSLAAADGPESPELARIRNQVSELIAARRRDSYSLGELWNQLVALLAQHPRTGGAKAWWARSFAEAIPLRTIAEYGQVAAAFSKDVVQALGMPKLSLLLLYARLRDVQLPADVATQPVEWTDAKGKSHRKPFGQCLMSDLRAATHSATPKRAPPAGPPLPPGVAEAFAALMQTLTPLVVRDDGFRLEPRMAPHGMRILLDLDADLFADVIAALDQAGLSFNTDT